MVRKLFFNEDENEKCMTIMEKKKYVAPECVVVELEGPVYMQSGSFDEGYGETETGGGTDMGSNRHRGEWGNLWK